MGSWHKSLPLILCISIVLFFPSSNSLSSSSYAEQSFSSAIAKNVVSSLTSLSNRLGIDYGSSLDDFKYDYKKPQGITTKDLVDSLREDFRRGYLFSGEIDPEIYAADCVFTDPTLSFSGLNTFRRNIANLRPVIEKYVGSCAVLLHSIELNEAEKKVVAEWTMYGNINLPWRPIIDLRGETTYTYDDNRDGAKGRIVDYSERWQIPAVAALLQLLTPTTPQTVIDIPAPSSSTSPVFSVYTVLKEEITREINDGSSKSYLTLMSDSEVQKMRKMIGDVKLYELISRNEHNLDRNRESLFIVQGGKIFGKNIVISRRIADLWFRSAGTREPL